jgi:hypothetical protein
LLSPPPLWVKVDKLDEGSLVNPRGIFKKKIRMSLILSTILDLLRVCVSQSP